MGADAGKSGTDDAKDAGLENGRDDAKLDGSEDGTGDDSKDKGNAKDDDTSGLKKALAAERKARSDAEKKLREQELAKLPELERYKSQAETLEKENAKLSVENLKMKIALELELPWRLAKRISGDTEDEMREDAADLLKDFKAKGDDKDDAKERKRPPNDGKANGKSSAVSMNDLLRAAARR